MKGLAPRAWLPFSSVLLVALGFGLYFALRFPRHIQLHLTAFGIANPTEFEGDVKTSCYHSFGGADHYVRLDGSNLQIEDFIRRSSGMAQMVVTRFDERHVLIDYRRRDVDEAKRSYGRQDVTPSGFLFNERPGWFDIELLTHGIRYQLNDGHAVCTIIRRAGQNTLYIALSEG